MNVENIFNSLIKWINDNNGHVNPKLNINISDQYNRTVYLTDDININDKLLSLPDKLILNYDKINLLVPNIDKWINDINSVEESNLLKMNILLLYEYTLKEKSFYYPYISILPQSLEDFAYHPLLNQTDLNIKTWKKLHHSFYTYIEKKNNDINTFFNLINKLNNKYKIFNHIDITFYKIKYIYMCILTRQWKNIGCVPFADMFQHSANSNITINSETKGFKDLISDKNIKKNSIIYDNYGIHDDFILLAGFGFTEDNNNDIIKYISINLKYNLQTSLSKYIEFEIQKFFKKYNTKTIVLTSKGISTIYLYIMRILSLTPEDIIKINGQDDYYKSRISINNEINAIKSIIEHIKTKSLFYTPEIRNLANNIIKSNIDNNITINLANIVLNETDILNTCVNSLHNRLLKLIDNPFNININVNIFK